MFIYSAASWKSVTGAVFDNRFDGKTDRALLAICLPRTQSLLIMPLVKRENDMLGVEPCLRLIAAAVAPIKSLRLNVVDLLMLKPDGSLSLLTHGLHELPLKFKRSGGDAAAMPVANEIVSLKDGLDSSVTLSLRNGGSTRVSLRLIPSLGLTYDCLLTLAMVLPSDAFFKFHHRFLLKWSVHGFVDSGASFDALRQAIYETLGFEDEQESSPLLADDSIAWNVLGKSESFYRFKDDPVFPIPMKFKLPPSPRPINPPAYTRQPHEMHVNFLNALHHIAQNMLLSVTQHEALTRLVPVICRLALVIRPEWADYWKRFFPDALGPWPSPAKSSESHGRNISLTRRSHIFSHRALR